MRESFREDLRYIVGRILNDEGTETFDQVERSMACLAAALENAGRGRAGGVSQGELVSFGYVAASICLWQIEQGTNSHHGYVFPAGDETVAM